jgi:CBS domain-containing protein
VKEMMTSELISVTPKTSLEECLKLMQTYHIRHLPVVDGERVTGILSMRDVMETVLKERESEIVGLENYIIGSSFQM